MQDEGGLEGDGVEVLVDEVALSDHTLSTCYGLAKRRVDIKETLYECTNILLYICTNVICMFVCTDVCTHNYLYVCMYILTWR